MKKVIKTVINRLEAGEHPVFGCPLCFSEVELEDNYCKECGVEFLVENREKVK